MTHDNPSFRSGFACFVGRPNAGKSTLTNAVIGSKIAITSDKPQTTRHAIRGILTRPDGQLILIDTPGLHRPRTLLGERLNDVVRETWSEVDVIGICLPSDQQIGPGDRYLIEQVAEQAKQAKLIAIATKSDLVSPQQMMEHLVAISQLEDQFHLRFEHIIPVSAVADEQVDTLITEMINLLPVGPQLYPAETVTEESDDTMITELIREAALDGVRDELPHSMVVTIDEMSEREGRPSDRPLLDIYANLVVERDSQKGIVIGHKGSRLKEVGTKARIAISEYLGVPVHLSIKVKVVKEWQRDSKALNRLGF